MTESYIRQHIRQEHRIEPTEKMVEKIESAIAESLPRNPEERVDDELFDLIYRTFKEYLMRIEFRSFYKDSYINLPYVPTSDINEEVRKMATNSGRDPSKITKSSVLLSKLLNESQFDELYERGREIISNIQNRLERISDDDGNLGDKYTHIDIWVAKCDYNLSQRKWSSLSSEHLCIPIKSDKSFKNKSIKDVWNNTTEIFEESDGGPIATLSKYTVSDSQDLYEFFRLEPKLSE